MGTFTTRYVYEKTINLTGSGAPTFALVASPIITNFAFAVNPATFTINVGSAAVRRFVLGIQKDLRNIIGITIDSPFHDASSGFRCLDTIH
jgi:hypothetical protein